MINSIKIIDTSLLKINIAEQFNATYGVIRSELKQDTQAMSVEVILYLQKMADSPALFSFDFREELDPSFIGKDISIRVRFFDKDGNDITTHQEVIRDFIERPLRINNYSYHNPSLIHQFDNTLNSLEADLNTALNLSNHATKEQAEQIEKLHKKFNKLITKLHATEIQLPQTTKPKILFDFPNTKHFSEIYLEQYKSFQDLKITELNRVNIFAGHNNSGKTSLLEAIRLLIAQNDGNDFLALQQLRGKFQEGHMPAFWIVEQIRGAIKIAGKFGTEKGETKIEIHPKQEEDDTFDKSNYLGSFHFQGSFLGEKYESNLRLFDKKEDNYSFTVKQLSHLCRFAYISPFSGYWNTQLFNAHANSIEHRYLPDVVAFLQQVDLDIMDIGLVEKNGLKRFLVGHKKHEKSLDLSQFGDGLQHIFRTILRFATAKNGVVLIDEIGTAIHHSLMKTYARFIQELAEKFNTQVFITTHSGEIIDAFINNNYKNEDISMYHVELVEGKASYKFIKGTEYKKLNNLIGLDLRD